MLISIIISGVIAETAKATQSCPSSRRLSPDTALGRASWDDATRASGGRGGAGDRILTAALFSTVGLLGTALFQLRGDVAKLAERLTALEVGQAEMRGEIAQVRGEIAGLRTAFESHVGQHA